MNSCSGPSGEALLIIATLVSLQIAEGKTADQLGTLAAFFSVLGDSLALLAVRRPAAENQCPCEPDVSGRKAETDNAHRAPVKPL